MIGYDRHLSGIVILIFYHLFRTHYYDFAQYLIGVHSVFHTSVIVNVRYFVCIRVTSHALSFFLFRFYLMYNFDIVL